MDASAQASTGRAISPPASDWSLHRGFLLRERVLIVELDGGQHEYQRAQDAARTQWLGEQGFRVLRFSDLEALIETEAVLTEIQNRL